MAETRASPAQATQVSHIQLHHQSHRRGSFPLIELLILRVLPVIEKIYLTSGGGRGASASRVHTHCPLLHRLID